VSANTMEIGCRSEVCLNALVRLQALL